MSNQEHRRIVFSGNSVDTPDPDWAGTHTVWDAGTPGVGPVLSAGEIVEVSPERGAIAAHYEIFDGVLDGATAVSPAPAVTLDLQIVTRHPERGTFEVGSLATGVAPQRRHVELEMPEQGLSAVRVTNVSGLPAAGAIVVYVSAAVHL